MHVGRTSQMENLVKTPRTTSVDASHEVRHDDDGLDVLSALKANIAQLEDMHGRLRYMMAEVEKLIQKKL